MPQINITLLTYEYTYYTYMYLYRQALTGEKIDNDINLLTHTYTHMYTLRYTFGNLKFLSQKAFLSYE